MQLFRGQTVIGTWSLKDAMICKNVTEEWARRLPDKPERCCKLKRQSSWRNCMTDGCTRKKKSEKIVDSKVLKHTRKCQ